MLTKLRFCYRIRGSGNPEQYKERERSISETDESQMWQMYLSQEWLYRFEQLWKYDLCH